MIWWKKKISERKKGKGKALKEEKKAFNETPMRKGKEKYEKTQRTCGEKWWKVHGKKQKKKENNC